MPINYWAILAGAGQGQRFNSATPKQYLTIENKAVISYSLDNFLQVADIKKVITVLAPTDTYWKTLGYGSHPKVEIVEGGKERFHSVFQGLTALKDCAAAKDWVLVHDAARPCISVADIKKLILEVGDHPVGGVLGVPLADTLKRLDSENKIMATVDRTNLWCAYTPQMFRYDLLVEAINNAISKSLHITDESSAIEQLGLQPLMVKGSRENIKITYAEDLEFVRCFLEK